ncbi:zinc-dependent alcohol dehydrogenase family protein [Panacagrimonas sp.]|uniref:zinc-dependent alcohol dehydrogenase family protein n=1 Tax=Panacagrimonas sp. TaxID=2480088 RepID=UPI003B52B70E
MPNAIRIRSPATLDSLYADTVEPRPPGPGEVVVRMRASSLNFHDLVVVTGHLRAADGRIPMSDGAGEVLAVGGGVDDLQVGDRVLSTFFTDWPDGEPDLKGFSSVPGDGIDGYACEFATVAAGSLTRFPRAYSFEEAATLTCAGVTAWRALMVEGRLKAGEVVLVQGSGGVSIFALQLAKSAGATVIATSSSDEKLERLRALGADHLINYKRTSDWGAEAVRLSGQGGVDHVIEIGGAGTLPQSMQAVRQGGHISLIGILAGREGVIPTSLLMRKQARLQGITVGSRRHQLDLVRACEATGIKPVIDRSFPLPQLADAFRYQQSGAHFGKICVSIP